MDLSAEAGGNKFSKLLMSDRRQSNISDSNVVPSSY